MTDATAGTTSTTNNRRGSENDVVAGADPVTRWWNLACAIVAVLLTAIALLPILDAGRAALGLTWIPSGDWAVLTLRVDDVGQYTPLVGPYSRFGWNHPGPLMYLLLSLPYKVLGGSPEALLASAATLNAATVAAIAAVAWRRGRLPMVALSMIVLAIIFQATGPALLRDPWNPFLTLLPLALVVFLAWSVIEGDTWMWPLLLFVTSFELQSHIGYLPMIGMIFVSIFVLAWQRSSLLDLLPSSSTARRWVIGTSCVVLLLCWLPVLIDQFFETGNLGAIASYFASPGDQPAGLGTALTTAADQLRLPSAPWLGRTEFAGSDGALLGSSVLGLLLPLGAMIGTGWIALRTRQLSALRFQIAVGATTLGGIVATARVIGPLFDWVVRWWWILAALWWLSILWTLWSSLLLILPTDSLRRIAITTLAAGSAAIIFMATGPVRSTTSSTSPPSPSTGIVLSEFLEPTLETLRGTGPLLVITTGSVRGDYGDAFRLQLERAGIDVVAEANMETHLGPQRSETRRDAAATLWIVSADAISAFRTDPSMKELGGWDPLTATERSEFEREKSALQDQLIAAGRADLAEALTNGTGGVDREALELDGVDQELLRSVEATRRKGDPVILFLGPARSA